MATQQDIMSKVMKLLERANHPGTPPAEAALAAERAEKMMAQHQIDRMDLKPEDKTRIVQDHWDLRMGDADSNFHWHIRSLMEAVIKHCGIRMHPTAGYAKDEDGRPDYQVRRFTVVGFPEDMAYAEQIWYRVFLEFVRSLNPKWDASKPLGENAYHFLQAGIKWSVIWKVAFDNGAETSTGKAVPDPATTKYNSSLKSEVRKYMEDNGLGEYSAHTQRHTSYRNSFVDAYSSTIRQRMRDLRAKAKDSVSDGDKFALALRTTEQQVDEEFYRLFPEFDPEVRRRAQEAADLEKQRQWNLLTPDQQAAALAEEARKKKADDEYWRKAEARARRNYRTVRTPSTSYDSAAYERGRKAGGRVNLNIDAEVKKNNRKELG